VNAIGLRYLHEEEGALPGAGRLKHEGHCPNRQRLAVNELDFANESVDVEVKDEVSVVGVALVAVDVIADSRPTVLRNARFTYAQQTRIATFITTQVTSTRRQRRSQESDLGGYELHDIEFVLGQ